MHTAVISDEQVRHYCQQGYVVIEKMFDADTVAESHVLHI
jgi:hypothetical protein